MLTFRSILCTVSAGVSTLSNLSYSFTFLSCTTQAVTVLSGRLRWTFLWGFRKGWSSMDGWLESALFLASLEFNFFCCLIWSLLFEEDSLLAKFKELCTFIWILTCVWGYLIWHQSSIRWKFPTDIRNKWFKRAFTHLLSFFSLEECLHYTTSVAWHQNMSRFLSWLFPLRQLYGCLWEMRSERKALSL